MWMIFRCVVTLVIVWTDGKIVIRNTQQIVSLSSQHSLHHGYTHTLWFHKLMKNVSKLCSNVTEAMTIVKIFSVKVKSLIVCGPASEQQR